MSCRYTGERRRLFGHGPRLRLSSGRPNLSRVPG